LPLSLVDNPAFIKMLSKFDNKYKLLGRKLLNEKYLQKAVENQKKNIQTQLVNEAEFVTLTLDCWSSVANNPYLGIN
jgi:hypothetical protein